MPHSSILPTKRIIAFNKQIAEKGFAPDNFLVHNGSETVFGINLAMAYPFPRALRVAYESIIPKLKNLDPGVYVYRPEQTHITVLTLIDFKKHTNPTDSERNWLENQAKRLRCVISAVFSDDLVQRIERLRLLIGQPVLTRGAVILPAVDLDSGSDPIGCKVYQIRAAVAKRLTAENLNRELIRPDIIHSTILRFKAPPANPEQFVNRFNQIKSEFEPVEVKISELLLTKETRPYMNMKGSKEKYILNRFVLGG